MKRLRVSTAIVLTFLLLFSGLIPGSGFVQAKPVVDDTPSNPVPFYEGSDRVRLAPDIKITEDGANNLFTDGYIKFEVENATSSDLLTLRLDQPETIPGVGELSLAADGTTLLLNGKAIGSVHSELDGQGKALQIDFATPLENGDFSQGDPTTGDIIPGWTIRNSNGKDGYPNQVWLDRDIARKTTGDQLTVVPLGTTPPTYNVTGTVYGTGEAYHYVTDVNYGNSSEGPSREGQEMLLGHYGSNTLTYIRRIANADGNRYLELGYRNGHVNSNRNTVHGTAFGPEAVSNEFTASRGDKLAFDWTAVKDASGDDYEVYGFLVQTDGGGTIDDLERFPHYEILYSRGGNNAGWETVDGEIPADGTYRFRFVAGSYDKTGGTLLGATLSVDNVRVLSGATTAEVVQAVASLVAYQHSPFSSPLVETERNVKITAQNTAGEVNDPLAEVKITLKDSLKLINVDVEDTKPNTATLTFNMAVGEPVDLTGLRVGGKKVEEIVSVDGDKVVVRLAGSIEPGPFKVSYDENEGSSHVASKDDPTNKLRTIPADPGLEGSFSITPLELVRVSADPTNPAQLRLKFNKPIAEGGLEPGKAVAGLSVGGKPVKFVGMNENGDELIVALDEPYQAGDLLAYDAAKGNIADALYPNNKLGNIPSASIPTVSGKLTDLGLNSGGKDLSLSPAFDPNKSDGYQAVVPNDVESVGISPEAFNTEDTFAKVSVNGKEVDPANGGWDNLPLQEGKNTITVTVYDKETGEALDTYSIVVWRTTNKLGNLETSEGTLSPEFKPEVEGYEINVPNRTREIDLKPTAVDPDAKIELSLNGGEKIVVESEEDYKNLPLKVGKNTVVFTITDRYGKVKEYTVTINRARANDGGGIINPGPGGGASRTERIEVDVIIGGDKQSDITKVEIERTTDSNGRISDLVTLTPDKAQEAADKAKTNGDNIARIVIPDANDEVSEVRVDVPLNSVRILQENGIDLEVYTVNGLVRIPNSSLDGVDESFYFRLVPVKEADDRSAVETRARGEHVVRSIAGDAQVDVISRPVQIETNLSSRPVTLTLPLRDVELPQNSEQRDAFLSTLRVFIEHPDGSKEVIEAEAVLMADGNYGLRFNIDGFSEDGLSTFTILRLAEEADGYHNHYMVGYEDGTFRPERSISRAEVAAILARTIAVDASVEDGIRFPDVSGGHWANDYIARASAAGLISGYPEGDFRPEGKITRAELAVIVFNYLGLEEGNASSFSDVAEFHWASGIIAAVQESGLMSGYPDGTFQPARELTRAEAVTVFNRLLNRGPLYGMSGPSWSDVPVSHWAYHDIEEASKDHSYLIRSQGGETWVSP